jgi:zinc and cadmium transporter
MSLLAWIILFTLLGGVLSVLAASAFLLLPESLRTRVLPAMVSFAIGALLGAAFLAVLPHALAAPGVRDMHAITSTVLLGLLGFFLLEKLVLWRHCHAHECEAHGSASVPYRDVPMPRAQDAQERLAGGTTARMQEVGQRRELLPRTPGVIEAHGATSGGIETLGPQVTHNHASASGYLILFGDGVHNFVDGVLIAAAFLTDVHLGVVTALAVAAHEIPQEVGDFAILLHSGFSRGKALFYNVLASLTTVVGGVLAYFSLGVAQAALPYVLAIAASSFIYIAVADLIPGLHKRLEPRATLEQVLLIGAGVLTIFFTHAALH